MSAGLVLAGRYRLISKLGQGGMGSVWRAEDMNLGAEVAVKLIDTAFVGSPEALKRFKREAQAAARIRSTYVVQVLDHGIDNGTPFIAMELLKGESLAKRLESAGTLSAEQTGYILGHVGRALALAHEHGIVHRDMKPENIFLVREGEDEVGKVLDFGIARQSGGLADSGGLKTQTGAVLGTPYYMSPEQATGQTVDSLTDIWSFGVIASECLTGRRAFDSESLGGLFHAICMAPMPVPSQLGTVPPGFDDWFARAVARDKPARFQTVKEAADGLRTLCGRTSGRASVLPRVPERGDAALSAGISVPSAMVSGARPVPAIGLQTTAVPSSRSISGLPKARHSSAALLVVALSAIGLGGLFVGWRMMSASESTAASAAAAVDSTPTSVTRSAAPSAIVAPVLPVALVEKVDAGPNENKQPVRSTVTPQPVHVPTRHAMPAKPTEPAAPAKPVMSATAKEPHSAIVKPPEPAAKRHNDNASGI